MRLVEADIEGFGQYRNQKISFAAGLNIIHGANESGKTTLMKFIEGILYGFYKPSQRRQYTEDYEKYRPWDGGSYAGTLIYENDGRRIGIYRNFAQEEIRMFDCDTQEDLTSQLSYNGVIRQVDPASRDWKISPAAFRNTISIVQGKACPDLEQISGELQESLLNLATAGDEDISVQNSLRSLRKQIEDIGNDGQEKTSRLGELTLQEETLKARLKAAKEMSRRQERIRGELEALPEEVEDSQEASELVKRVGRTEQKEHLLRLEQEVQRLREQEKQLRHAQSGTEQQYEEAIGLQTSVQTFRERLAEAKLQENERQQDLQRLQEEPSESENKPSEPWVLYCGLGGLICSVICMLLVIWVSPFFLIGTLLGVGMTAGAFIYSQKRMRIGIKEEQERRERSEEIQRQRAGAEALLQEAKKQREYYAEKSEAASERLRQILQRLGVTSIQEYAARMQECAQAETIQGRIVQLEEDRERWEKFYASAIVKERRALLRQRLEDIQKEEDPSALREQLAQVVQQKDRLMMERDSLRAAAAAIESLSQEVKKEYAPILTENMKKTVENITSGRYNTIYVSDQDGIRAMSADGREISMDQVSAGTGDQIYFAVRLGMIDLLSPKVKLPLILDDAFARYDDERLVRILKLLRQEARSRQILIFSCQLREKELLSSMRAVFQYSEL